MAKKSHNPVVLQPDTNIGMSSAETDDEFLFNCFVNHPAMEAATNLESAKIFLSGRTGTGKTAFLRMIESREKNCTFVDLEDLSLNYVANSDIVQFLNALVEGI